MSEYFIQDTTLSGIADAIRAKNGSTGTIAVSDFATQIEAIETTPEGLVTYEETTATHTRSSGLSSVTYGANKFVAPPVYGDSNSAYSENGINWTSAVCTTSKARSNIVYGAGKFVVVGDGVAAYSSDGATWTAGTMPSVGNKFIAYGDGKFVSIPSGSYSGATGKSTDGVTWVQGGTIAGAYVDWYGVAYGAGKFVTFDRASKKVAYSTDGSSWTVVTNLPSSGNWYRIAYGGGKFVIISNGANKAAYSTDGITWTATTLPESASWTTVAYGNDMFVALANSVAAYSTDGVTWIKSTLPTSVGIGEVTYGSGKFVAVSNTSNTVLISYDGINWSTSGISGLVDTSGADVTEETLAQLTVAYKPGIAEFIIMDTTYWMSWQCSFEYGMTWEEWVVSSYNADPKFTISGGNVYYGSSIIKLSGKNVLGTDTIVADGSYRYAG